MIPFVRASEGSSGGPRSAPASTLPAGIEALRLSVVIPADRRADLLVRCLEALFAQTLDPHAFEVIVVDDGRTGDIEAVVDAFKARIGPVVRHVRPRLGRGPAVARNAGWRAAYAKVIAFTEADTIPAPDWLEQGESALQPGLVALAGKVEGSPPARCESGSEGLDAPAASDRETTGFASANAFVRRSALLTVAGFDERFQRACREDADLEFRLLRDAGAVGRSDAAVVQHPPRPERWAGCLHAQRNAFFDALLYKKHPKLYRERILAAPPWDYYAIVALTLAAPTLWAAGVGGSAGVSLLLALVGVLRLAARRLRRTVLTPEHVVENVVTSAVIPFLAVYWRLRGALHFRVLFL
ncbi:MAG: glycosyltransferase family A protein [Caldimonas sp.]